MRVRHFVLASIVSVSCSAWAGAQPGHLGQPDRGAESLSPVPLGVAARLNASGDQMELELTNDSAKTAVAWTIAVVGLPPVGGRPQRVRIGQDFYPQLISPAKAPVPGPVPPGKRAVVTTFPPTAYPGASFAAIAVVYSDGTVVGDEESIANFFKRRAGDARGWKDVSAALDELVKGRISRASVEAAIRTIEAGTAMDRDTEGARQSAVRNLRRFLESTWTLQSRVEDYAAHARTYAEGAASHAVRR